MRSDPHVRRALALGFLVLLASAAPLAASRGPTVAIITSSRVGPFETASRAIVDTLRASPRQLRNDGEQSMRLFVIEVGIDPGGNCR
jgi:hypothetical protein